MGEKDLVVGHILVIVLEGKRNGRRRKEIVSYLEQFLSLTLSEYNCNRLAFRDTEFMWHSLCGDVCFLVVTQLLFSHSLPRH